MHRSRVVRLVSLTLIFAAIACGPLSSAVEEVEPPISPTESSKPAAEPTVAQEPASPGGASTSRAVREFSVKTTLTDADLSLADEIFDLIDQAKWDEALAILNPLIKSDPENVTAYTLRARVYNNSRQPDLGLADADRGLELEPGDPNLMAQKGGSLFLLNRYDEALEILSAALEIDPNYAVALNNRGLVHYGSGNYDQAVADYTAALENNPVDANIYLGNRGVAHLELANDYDAAIEDLTGALESSPNDIAALFNRGNAYINKGEYQKAIDDYTAAIEINPEGIPDAYFNRAVAYEQIGNNDAAAADRAEYARLTQLQ